MSTDLLACIGDLEIERRKLIAVLQRHQQELTAPETRQAIAEALRPHAPARVAKNQHKAGRWAHDVAGEVLAVLGVDPA